MKKTNLKTRFKMAWPVLRGRSVMYRMYTTMSGYVAPKTEYAVLVENDLWADALGISEYC